MGAGQDLDTGVPDGIIRFETNISDQTWHTVSEDGLTDPNLGDEEIDLFSVALHEALHVLGFASLISADGTPRPIRDSNGNLLFESGIYSVWDQYLYSQMNDQFLITPIDDPVECCNEYTFNEEHFPNMPDPIDGDCSNRIVFNGSSVSPNVNNGANLSGVDPSDLNNAVLNKLSHLQCSSNGERFVMAPTISEGPAGVNRIISNTELQILCDLGFQVENTCDEQCTIIAQNDFVAKLGSISVININDEILNNDIISDDFEIEFDFECGNIPDGLTNVENGLVYFDADALESGFYRFCYTLIGCDGTICHEAEVILYLGINAECNLACELFCRGDFESFIPNATGLTTTNYNSQLGLGEFIFQGTTQNTADIIYVAPGTNAVHFARFFPAFNASSEAMLILEELILIW